jgi:hypothetical protein
MSQPPPSYPVPSGYPPGHPPLPPKDRPSGWWFVVGAGLIVLALGAGVGLFIWTLSAFFQTDATVPADGQTHQITVDTDGQRMLWRDDDIFDPGCAVVDLGTGNRIELRPVTSQFTKDFGEGEWTAAYRFDPGTGRLAVTCAAAPSIDDGSLDDGSLDDGSLDDGGEVQIGPAPSIGGFVGGLIATIAIPSLLGLFGLAVLIVNGILWSTRPARPRA